MLMFVVLGIIFIGIGYGFLTKNKENLLAEEDLLRELLQKKYHIRLTPETLAFLLIKILHQINDQEKEQAYQKLKKSWFL